MDNNKPEKKKKLFGELLVEGGLISDEQLKQALAFGRENGCKLGESLQKLGLVTEEAVAKTIAKQLDIPYVNFDKIKLDPNTISLLPKMIAKKHKAIVLGKRPGETLVSFADPLNIFAIDEVSRYIKDQVIPCVSEESKILEAIDRHHTTTVADRRPAAPPPKSATPEKVIGKENKVEESDAVVAVDKMMLQAVRLNSSDIHIEPMQKEVRVRFRVDGLLREAMTFPLELHPSLTSRIKILSNMDIGERRKPQDGRFEIPVAGKIFDIRVSSLPLKNQEKIVLRLLDKTKVRVDLQDLGFAPAQEEIFKRNLIRPHGIILVTGPTGSGKTTTLYGALNFINSIDKNIVTVEDPLEYELMGINQVQVNPKADLTFANALRSILRQDPDVVMIGEIRDVETAEIAIQAALTGHLVLSTLHTNDACSAVARLIDMDIPPFLIASSLCLVLAQRLVRLLCPKCKKPFSPPAALQKGLNLEFAADLVFYQAVGCHQCEQTGYKGRVALYELLPASNEIKSLIMNKSSSHELNSQAIAAGMVPLRQSGIQKLLAGITSVDEVLRVTLEAQD